MTALYPHVPIEDERDTHEMDFEAIAESAYEEYWHATEDDGQVTDFDEDEREENDDTRDVYFSYVSAIEA